MFHQSQICVKENGSDSELSDHQDQRFFVLKPRRLFCLIDTKGGYQVNSSLFYANNRRDFYNSKSPEFTD